MVTLQTECWWVWGKSLQLSSFCIYMMIETVWSQVKVTIYIEIYMYNRGRPHNVIVSKMHIDNVSWFRCLISATFIP